nr:hypothetical protein [Acidobacteriota bacterium]
AGRDTSANGDAAMTGLEELIPVVGVKQACEALNMARSENDVFGSSENYVFTRSPTSLVGA